MCQQNTVCMERFGVVDEKIERLSKNQIRQDSQITELAIISARLNERLCSLTAAVKLLTRALWGVAGSAMAGLISFFIWYIQTRG